MLAGAHNESGGKKGRLSRHPCPLSHDSSILGRSHAICAAAIALIDMAPFSIPLRSMAMLVMIS